MGRESSVRQQIRGLLFLVGGSIAAACLVVALLLYIYNPSGCYRAGDLLLAPNRLSEVGVLEYRYFDQESGWQALLVAESSYRHFYLVVAADESVDEVIDVFEVGVPMELTLKREGGEVFHLELTTQGPYYRIALDDGQRWAYFHHVDIDAITHRLFGGQ